MRVEATEIEGTLIAHQIELHEIKQRDKILVQFKDDGETALCLAYKDGMITLSPPTGMQEILKNAMETNQLAIGSPRQSQVRAMYLVGVWPEDVSWELFNILNEEHGGTLGTRDSGDDDEDEEE